MTFISANNGSRVLHTACPVRTVMSGLVCASGFGSMQCGTGTNTPLGIYHMRAATLIRVPTGPFGRSSPPHQGGRGEGVGNVTFCWLRSTKETPMSELLMGPRAVRETEGHGPGAEFPWRRTKKPHRWASRGTDAPGLTRRRPCPLWARPHVSDTSPACSWHGWPSLSGHPLCMCCRSAVSLFSTDIGESRLGPDIPVRDQP